MWTEKSFVIGWIEIGYDLKDWALPFRVHQVVCIHILCFYFDFTIPRIVDSE